MMILGLRNSILTVALLLLFVLPLVSSFFAGRCSTFESVPRKSRRKFFCSTLSLKSKSKPNEHHHGESSPFPSGEIPLFKQKLQQLWLDLRGTQLFPNEALAFLSSQLTPQPLGRDALIRLIDGVVVSSEVFDKMATDALQRNHAVLLHQAGQASELVASNFQTHETVSVGCVATCNGNGGNLVDPMLALDIVVARQEWLLVDLPRNTTAPIPWLQEQMTSLITLLSSAPLLVASEENESDLVVPSQQAVSLPNSQGGIGFGCHDLESFLGLDRILAEIKANDYLQGTSTTESGLLVPNHSISKKMNTMSSSPATAFVLPLELSVWQTAMDIQQLKE